MTKYTVRRSGRPADAVIRRGGEEVATLRGEGNLLFRLESKANESWVLDPRVHGEVRPFSMNVTAPGSKGEAILTIRNHVFFHGAKAFMLTSIPEDVHPADHVFGKRHVNRLENFPFSRLEDIDLQTWGRLRMQRGISVGTFDGLGTDEFRVTISQELEDIGLQLAAASYLLYSTG
ncbi:MAG: hypothetical protein JRN06_05680 [Nitrososphaerota archaeon]|nr:hypothetical protein [Nitrososphaerota archaeon]MDG7024105.1 hypothetical protein [Nitrososphaerota archaeon]